MNHRTRTLGASTCPSVALGARAGMGCAAGVSLEREGGDGDDRPSVGRSRVRHMSRSSAIQPYRGASALGATLRKIVDDVNEARVPTAQGAAEYPATVRHFLLRTS